MTDAKKPNPYAGYHVGLVMSHGGMNDYQLAEVRQRLSDIARLGGAGEDKLKLTVPTTMHHSGPTAAAETETLLRGLETIEWLDITILEVGPIEQLMPYLCNCDEVWCITARMQSERTIRPARIYALAQAKFGPSIARRFKMIHYWAEAGRPANQPPRRTKGYL